MDSTSIGGSVSRRQFAAFGAAAAFAGCTGMSGSGVGDLAEADVVVPGASGSVRGYFVHPENGRHPGAVIWSGATQFGGAQRDVARQLARQGWSVLVVDANPAALTDYRQVNRDSRAFVGWLRAQVSVDDVGVARANSHQLTDGYVLRTVGVKQSSVLVAVADSREMRAPRRAAALRDMARAVSRMV